MLQHPPKQFTCAFAPFPRSTWIHPDAPSDHFDRVCKVIWGRAREAEEELGVARGPPRTPRTARTAGDERGDPPPGGEPRHHHHRAVERQKETGDLGLTPKCEEDKQQCHTEFTLPCRYLLGRRHPCVAKPVEALSPLMEVKMKLNGEEDAERKRNVGKDVEDKQRIVENSLKKIEVPESISRTDKQSLTSEPGPLATNPICCGTEEAALHLQDEEEASLPSGDACTRGDEQDMTGSSGGSSSDDGSVSLPRVRSCATDSSDDVSLSDHSDSEMEESEIPRLSDESTPEGKQCSPPSSAEDFPPLRTIRSGIVPRPAEARPSRKMQGQWETPLSFHPHDIPAAALASSAATPAPAPVQGKAKAPQANAEKANAPPAATAQQKAYDLLADFPALQPPKRPSAFGALRDGNPKAKDANRQKGPAHPPTIRQQSGASRRRRMENAPREDLSICAGDQKSVAILPAFGPARDLDSPTINRRGMKANNQPPPRVAGADGAGVNARSWANAAKAGMKQAAAPQEKARACNFRQIVTVNGAKARCSAVPNFANKVTPSHRVTDFTGGPQPCNTNQFVRPGDLPTPQHSAAQAHQANCPPGFSCPRFAFQQGRGKHGHV